MTFPEIEEHKKCYYCVDDMIGKVVRKYLELKMNEHSILVIVPDHLPFHSDPKSRVYELFFIFPGIEKVVLDMKVKGEITYYGFGPTILNLIGVKEYVPDFPFGRDIYIHNDEKEISHILNKYNITKHEKPDENDLAIIYKFLH